ncbi:MAG: methylase, partial [Cyanobacteriota bacterium erpe_2018_sw_39hr_WHONDRS-SW48-000098_B_bin.30]|nr:methylase [Cyanobacteriota bacterium erpe_2018_sw_39hr_WHONDRS-SW48-000098_B_bin.30]
MPPLKTTTASPKVKKTGPALLKKLARELAIIADHDQKTILRLAAHLALAANGIQPITNLPLDKRALNELWTIFGSADRANRADCANEADRTNVADCANGVEDKLASALDHSEFARVLTAPLALEQITDSQIGGLVKLARAMARGCDLEVFRDPLFVASLREAIVETGTAAQKSRHTIDSPLLPTQFFTPTSVANKIAKETPCRPGETILDPACGGGHLLVPVFFECLKQHELAGATDTASSARQIFEQQLYGYDIDQSLVDICRFSLYLAARQVTRAELPTPNIKVRPGPSVSLALAPGGSTDTAQKETRLQVDHIVMNPPYQSTRTID